MSKCVSVFNAISLVVQCTKFRKFAKDCLNDHQCYKFTKNSFEHISHFITDDDRKNQKIF